MHCLKPTKMATLLQLWNDWELQALVLLSFILQVFLFFSGGLRRHSTNGGLRLLIWLAYLMADFVAVYTLGQLSRQKTDATGLGEPHQLTFLWTPFLLIHLGGQDTVTAFSVEDNELWLRHLLNLLTQVGLALYVFWKSAAHSWFLASAIFAFVAGIIKYGERIWALKSASQKALRSSTKSVIDQFPELEEDEQELGYFTMVKFALSTSPGVRNVFVGRKLEQMEVDIQAAFTGSQMGKNIQGAFICLSIYNENQNGELVFKVIEIEQGIMYENLYTKAMVLRTWAGAMLRFVTLVSLVVAFALFVADNKRWHRHSRIDVAVTLTLVTGAFCLEICAVVVMVLASPWTWAILRSCKCHKLSRAAWCIFRSVSPESRPLWSNSMGQYNFISSCFSDSVVGKVMSLVGAKQLWKNFLHTKYVDVKPEMKKLLFEDQCFQAVFGTSISPGLCANPTSGVGSALDIMLRKPFEEAILSLHIYTDIFLYRCKNPTGATSCDYTDEKRLLMHRCRTLSEYVCYLLVVHPEMLPVSGSVTDVLQKASDTVATARSTAPTKNKLLEKLAADGDRNRLDDPVLAAASLFRGLAEEAVHSHESLQVLVRAWMGILLYAAGKSRGEVHARQLNKGGELLTFLWLHLAHNGHGDLGSFQIELVRLSAVNEGGRKIFVWGFQRPR